MSVRPNFESLSPSPRIHTRAPGPAVKFSTCQRHATADNEILVIKWDIEKKMSTPHGAARNMKTSMTT